MNKNKKIKLLIQENKKLISQNDMLRKREQNQLTNQMVDYMQTYSELNKRIFNQLIKLNELKWDSIHTKWLFKIKFSVWKIKKYFSI